MFTFNNGNLNLYSMYLHLYYKLKCTNKITHLVDLGLIYHFTHTKKCIQIRLSFFSLSQINAEIEINARLRFDQLL